MNCLKKEDGALRTKSQTYRFERDCSEKNGSAPVLGKAHLERKDVWIEISRKNQSCKD